MVLWFHSISHLIFVPILSCQMHSEFIQAPYNIWMLHHFIFLCSVCLIIIFQIICIALIAIHISGSSKLCSAYGAHLFTSPRVVMVWIMVRKCYKIQGKNHWSLQQSHDKGTQASGKHSYPWACLPSLQITVPPPSSLLSLSISVCSLSFSQGARRIVPEWQDLDFEARQFTAKVSGEVDPQEPVTPPKQSQDPITDSSPEEDDQESKSELWWISTIFSSLEHFDGKPKALSHNIIYPKNILHFKPETVCLGICQALPTVRKKQAMQEKEFIGCSSGKTINWGGDLEGFYIISFLIWTLCNNWL